MTAPFRLAFLGIDNPHGAGWRELLLNFGDAIEIAAIMPGYDGALTSLEERYARVPRFDAVAALIAGGQFRGASVCLSNGCGPDAIVTLASAPTFVSNSRTSLSAISYDAPGVTA